MNGKSNYTLKKLEVSEQYYNMLMKYLKSVVSFYFENAF